MPRLKLPKGERPKQALTTAAFTPTDSSRCRRREAVLSGVLVVGLSLASTGVMAWGAKAYYPSSVSPVLPGPEQAQRIAVAPPGFLDRLRDAHQASLNRGWKGPGAAFGDADAPLAD